MKQLIVILLVCIGVTDLLAQSANMDLPIEKDTLINGIETKLIILHLKYERGNGTIAKMIICFRNPVTKEWIWLDADRVPLDLRDGFTHSFSLKIRSGFENMDTQFLDSIIENKDGTLLWRCSCTKYKQNGPI